jgi:phosphotransferase system IIA component
MSATPVLAPVPGRHRHRQLEGRGFTVHAEQGADVTAGQLMVTYDVSAVEGLGRNPIVPVVALEKQAEDIALDDAFGSGAALSALDTMFTVDD